MYSIVMWINHAENINLHPYLYFILTVKREMPKFLRKPQPFECMEHDEVQFQTTVIGKPQPTVEWYRGELKLEPSDRIIFEDVDNVHTLIIKNIKKDEEGMVTVKAINDMGDMAASARLRVTGMSCLYVLFSMEI
jgi:hypothetical protein